MWTIFHDMHSGGSQKLQWDKVFIQLPEKLARTVFYNRFGRWPQHVTCSCCGADYSVHDDESLDELTAFYRNCATVYELPDGRKLSEKQYFGMDAKERAQIGWRNIKSYYAEHGKPDGPPYTTLEDYMKNPSCLFIREDEINPDEMISNIYIPEE